MISILTPSRSRPTFAKRMYDSAYVNPGCKIEIKFYLNVDDPNLEDYKLFLKEDEYIVGPNQSTCYSWNLLADKAKYDILFLVGDDVQFITPGWGDIIIAAFNRFPDKILCAYPKVPNLSKNKNPHFCLHKNWINALGYYLPPHFYHWYIDTYIGDVARRIGRFHCLNFELPIETIKDQVSRSYHDSWMRQRDEWTWPRTVRHREKDAETLLKFIKDFK